MTRTIQMQALFLLLLFPFPVFFFGCAKVGPDYEQQALETDAEFEDATPEQLDPSRVIRTDWWKNFQDPALDTYIANAISGSYDLKILMGRINAAGALIDQSEASLYPSLNLDVGGRFEDSATRGSSESYQAQGQLNWELDLWGKNRRKIDAAEAEQKALKADYRAGYLKLVSDIAVAYFNIRQYDILVGIANDYIEYQTLIETIYKQQLQEGLIDRGTLMRQQAILKATKQDSLEMKRGRAIQEHKLAALTGRPPGKVKVSQSETSAIRPLDVPVGLPSSLLQRRPDIIAAEYRLFKATQAVGVAQAARLPSISLSAEGGLTSTTLTNLLSGGFLAFLPKITLPIFDGGKLKAEVKKAEHEVEVAKNQWAKTANEAFQEVADSLTNLANRREQLTLLQSQVDDLRGVRGQLEAKFKMGLVSQLQLNDTIETLYEAEKNRAKMDTLLMNDTVLLYKALGGGWPSETVAQ